MDFQEICRYRDIVRADKILMILTPFARSFEFSATFTVSIFLEPVEEFNQTCIDYGYMILTC